MIHKVKNYLHNVEDRKLDRINKFIILIAGGIGIIVAIASLVNTIQNIWLNKQIIGEKSEIINEVDTNMDWIEEDDAVEVLSEKYHFNIHYEHDNHNYNVADGNYDFVYGVSLVSLFSNKTNADRTIIGFSVCCDSISEDLSPRIKMRSVWGCDKDGNIIINIYNYGWSDSGELRIIANDIKYLNYYNHEDIAVISINHDEDNEWIVPSVPAGNEYSLIIPQKLFSIDWIGEDKSGITCVLEFEIISDNYHSTADALIYVSQDHVEGDLAGEGGDSTNYVIVVDTSNTHFEKEYTTYQTIPALSTVKLPIFIYPTKSCEISIRVSFELDDGEIVLSEPLLNSRVLVPQYNDFNRYINGEELSWKELTDDCRVYFPFKTVTEILSEDYED